MRIHYLTTNRRGSTALMRHADLAMTARQLWQELRVTRAVLLDWRACPLSKIVLALGVSYLFIPLDLIPDRLPIIGHLDEAGFLLLGFVGSRGLVPASILDQFLVDCPLPARPGRRQHLQFILRVLRADLANFFPIQYRHVDGLMITGKNSGTHWLKFMLSCAIAEQFGVPPPLYSSGTAADEIISHPRWPARYQELPRIGSSHTIPSIALSWSWLNRLFPLPPIVVLVRDIAPAMGSNYVKWQQRYHVTASRYVRGDPSGQRYVADLWWYMHFFNRWGDVATAQPGKVLVVRYEDLLVAPEACLRRVLTHFGLWHGECAIAAALRYVHRDAIRSRLDPSETELVMAPEGAGGIVRFTPSDGAFMCAAMQRYLRCDFGYGYVTAEPEMAALWEQQAD